MKTYYVAGKPFSGDLYHSGVKGMKWGVRNYQNPDGSLTEAGKRRYEVQGTTKTSYGTRVSLKYNSGKRKATSIIYGKSGSNSSGKRNSSHNSNRSSSSYGGYSSGGNSYSISSGYSSSTYYDLPGAVQDYFDREVDLAKRTVKDIEEWGKKKIAQGKKVISDLYDRGSKWLDKKVKDIKSWGSKTLDRAKNFFRSFGETKTTYKTKTTFRAGPH